MERPSPTKCKQSNKSNPIIKPWVKGINCVLGLHTTEVTEGLGVNPKTRLLRGHPGRRNYMNNADMVQKC